MKKPLYTGKLIPIAQIQKVVSEVTKIPVADINLPEGVPGAKKKEKVTARQLSMCFACLYTKYSLERIGMSHGGRGHATVLHARKTVNRLVDVNDREIMQFYPEVKLRLKQYVPIKRSHGVRDRNGVLKALLINKVPMNIRHRVLYPQFN